MAAPVRGEPTERDQIVERASDNLELDEDTAAPFTLA
jgi:hypothetical protein